MDPATRELLRRRNEPRLAEERRRRAEAEAARAAAEQEAREAEAREIRRQEEALAERLLPLTQLQFSLLELLEIVRQARRPGQVLPQLRQVAAEVQSYYQPDIEGGQELVGQLQAVVAELVLAFNDNANLVLQLGSYEYRTIQELIQTITTTMGVDIEIAAPIMDTSRDEEIARQLAGPAAAPAAAASSSYRPQPVRVDNMNAELEEYRRVLVQLRSMRYATQSQLQSILRQLQPPPEDLNQWQRNQVRTALENLRTYVTNRWASAYDLREQLGVIEEFLAQLNE
jgi:hypothetical protein